MEIPSLIETRLAKLSEKCGVKFRVVKYWENEFRPGWYCWYRGEVLSSELMKIEIAGTLAIEIEPTRKDEVDMFIFVNGVRVGDKRHPYHYLVRQGDTALFWDDLDEGYEQFDTLQRFDELENE